MKNLILLLLLLPCVASAQFPMVAAWQSAATVSFSPLQVDSLKMLYLTDYVADTLGKADGDTTHALPNAAKWSKPYVNDGDMFNVTSAQKPVFRDSSGTRWLQFDGIDDFLAQTTTPRYTQPTTIYFVAKLIATVTNFETYYDAGAGTARNALLRSGGNSRFDVYAGTDTDTRTFAYGYDSLCIVRVVYNGASSYIEVNGNGQACNPGTQGLDGFRIARHVTNTTLISRIRFFAAAVIHKDDTATERTNMLGYFKTKYGVTW